MNYQTRTACRLCSSSQLESAFSFPDTPVGDHYTDQPAPNAVRFPLHLHRCTRCGHLQLAEVVNPEVLYANFTYRTAVSIELEEHFRAYARHVAARVALKPGDWVLDIGSNDGTLLRHFQAAGCSVLGVDPARQIAAEANASGIETLPGYFDAAMAERIHREKGAARLILSNNTFANIDDLASFCACVTSLMARDSVFVFETGYAIDLAEKMIVDNIYHEHLNYFLVTPLTAFFERFGLELCEVEHIPTKGGSIRGYVAWKGAGHLHASVADSCRHEDARGMFESATFSRLNQRFLRNRDELHRHLDRAALDGPIAGFGASVGVTTLLYSLHLGGRLGVLADDNPRKQGLFSPGTCFRVIPGDSLSAKEYPNTLILPWRYADAIRRKRSAYLAQHGTFHVALPEVRTLRCEQ